jgi:hypothetical protein
MDVPNQFALVNGGPFVEFWLIYPKYHPASGGIGRSAGGLSGIDVFGLLERTRVSAL